ncbi:hypothetical protein M1D88_13945 [Arthrobacter sp. R1-13]
MAQRTSASRKDQPGSHMVLVVRAMVAGLAPRARAVQPTVVRAVDFAATVAAPVVRARVAAPVVGALVALPTVAAPVAMPADPIEAVIPTRARFP